MIFSNFFIMDQFIKFLKILFKKDNIDGSTGVLHFYYLRK